MLQRHLRVLGCSQTHVLEIGTPVVNTRDPVTPDQTAPSMLCWYGGPERRLVKCGCERGYWPYALCHMSRTYTWRWDDHRANDHVSCLHTVRTPQHDQNAETRMLLPCR